MLLARTWGWKKPPPPAWSTALIAASRTIKFWKALISDLAAAQANVDLILLQIGTFLQWDSMIPLETNPAEAKVKLAQNGPCYKLMVKTMEDTHDLEEVRNAAHDILTLMVQVLDLVSETWSHSNPPTAHTGVGQVSKLTSQTQKCKKYRVIIAC